MSGNKMSDTRHRTGLYDVLLIILMLLTMFAIVIGRAPYLHDFAEWLYQGQIVYQILLGSDSGGGFTMATYPVPNSLVTMILAGLSFIFKPLWAGRVFLILMLLAWFVIIRLFCSRFVDPQRRGAASFILFASTALATFFWYGFVSYQLAMLLFTWFLAIHRNDTPASVIAFFGLAIFFAHAIIFLVFGLFLGVSILLKWNRALVAGMLPATIASLWFLTGRHFAEVEPQEIGAVWSGLREAAIYKAGYPAMLGPFKNFLWPDGSSLLEAHSGLYWPGLMVNFAWAAAVGVLMAVVLWKYFRGDQSEEKQDVNLRRVWVISITLITLFYLFSPYHFFGLVNAGGRVLLPLLLLTFMLAESLAVPFIRVVVWPVVIFSFVTSGSYFYLMLQTRQPDFSPLVVPVTEALPSDSVLDFNEKLYVSTRYKYFNYRVFTFSQRFDQVESEQFQGLTFRHGMLIKYRPESR